MLAELAVEGRLYNLPRRAGRAAYEKAEYYGWSPSRQFLRFMVYDNYGRRQIVLVMPNEDIQPV